MFVMCLLEIVEMVSETEVKTNAMMKVIYMSASNWTYRPVTKYARVSLNKVHLNGSYMISISVLEYLDCKHPE